MNVPFQFVDLAMNMKEERAIKLVLSAKPDTSVSKVNEWINILSVLSSHFRTPITRYFRFIDDNSFFWLTYNVLIQLQAVLGLKVMKKKMISMILRMSLILQTRILAVHLRQCFILTLPLGEVLMLMVLEIWLLTLTPHPFQLISLSWPMAKRWISPSFGYTINHFRSL